MKEFRKNGSSIVHERNYDYDLLTITKHVINTWSNDNNILLVMKKTPFDYNQRESDYNDIFVNDEKYYASPSTKSKTVTG